MRRCRRRCASPGARSRASHARLSRYSYLVSLLPRRIVDDLGLDVRLARRRVSSYTPDPADPARGLLVADDVDATRRAFARVGAAGDHAAWTALYAGTQRLARAVFPTLTGPLPTRAELRERVGDDGLWTALVERPLGERITETLRSDLVRGVVATDGLIGTLTRLDDPSPAANRCFLYHVIGNGTGRWDVPVGGMGTVAGALERAARAAGARIVTGAEVTAIDPAGRVAYTGRGEERTAHGDRVLAGVAPWVLERLCPGACPGPKPVGAQVKVNLLLRRLPALHDHAVAGSGGLRRHPARERDVRTARPRVHRGPARRDARTAAVRGLLPLADRPDDLLARVGRVRRPRADRLRSAGPGPVTDGERRRLARPARARRPRLAAVGARGARRGPAGHRCRTGGPASRPSRPSTWSATLGMPGGHIFHGDLAWPFLDDGAPRDTPARRWGVATGHPRVLLCGAGAVRGGGVSGVGGHNAAMAVLADG